MIKQISKASVHWINFRRRRLETNESQGSFVINMQLGVRRGFRYDNLHVVIISNNAYLFA